VSAHVATVWTIGIPSAVAVVMLYGLLGLLGLSPAMRALLAAGYGFATLAFPYATLFYGHQLVAALLVIAFALLARARAGLIDSGRAPGPTLLAAAGLLLGAAVAVEYPAALAVAPIAIYAASFVRPLGRLTWLVAGLASVGAAVAAYHAVVFGGPLTLPYQFSTQPHRHLGVFMGLGAPQPEALAGILWSRYRGLFHAAPWLLLGLPGAAVLLRRPRWRREALVCVAIILLFVWLNASLVDWQGGWAMGPRYLVPAIPFVVFLAGGVVSGWPARWRGLPARVATGALALALAGSGALMLAGTAVKPEVPVTVRRPFGDYLLPAFRAGRIAISTQSIDSATAPAAGPRQAWNLGHRVGLDGRATLIPLAVYAAACAAWLTAAVRRDRSSAATTTAPAAALDDGR
jgi:hypothetical protein